MAKARDAFRTISEVSEWLDTPTHVLRFWESKFPQIRPVKGAGGRRYYRPEDMDLLGGIKQLLHEDGLTIKGTQKMLREKGVKYVATLGPSITAELAQAADAGVPDDAAAPETDMIVESVAPEADAPVQPQIDETAPEPVEIADAEVLQSEADMPATTEGAALDAPEDKHPEDLEELSAPSAPTPQESAAARQGALPFGTPDMALPAKTVTEPEAAPAVTLPDGGYDTAPPEPVEPEPEVAAPEPAPAAPQIDLPPPLPDEIPAVPARLLGQIPAETKALQARAAEIAPLLARLENLRDRMRAN